MPSDPGFGVVEPGNRDAEGPTRKFALLLMVTGAIILLAAPKFS